MDLKSKFKSSGDKDKESSSVFGKLKLEQLFKACDAKGEGKIGREEFKELCKRFHISLEDSDVIFIDLDHDGDGQVDFEDFSHGFRDFLTPGSRRGSFQINFNSFNTDTQSEPSEVVEKHLVEMEKKHASAKLAWRHFTTSVGSNNADNFVKNCEQIFEELPTDSGTSLELNSKLEKAVLSLITHVQSLNDEYKTLETSFKKERESHSAQLAALGYELDQQLAKSEAKAKLEARHEAQKQMDLERKRIANEMENQLSDLSAQMRTFQKVEEWLSKEETMKESSKKEKNPEETAKLFEAENENRSLRSALIEAQLKATLLQNQLAQKKDEYLSLIQDFQSEKLAANEYKNQCDLMQNHLSLLGEANRTLSDANDCLSSLPNTNSLPHRLSIQDEFAIERDRNLLTPDGYQSQPPISHSNSSLNINSLPNALPNFILSETDSGRGASLEELKADESQTSRQSPITSNLSSPTIVQSIQNEKLPEQQRASFSIEFLPEQRAPLNLKTTPEQRVPLTFEKVEKRTPPLTLEFQDNKEIDDFVDISLDFQKYPHLPPNTYYNKKRSSSLSSNASRYDDGPTTPARTFKVILAGDAAVGKTSFIERVCYGHFSSNHSSTIGVDFRIKTLKVEGKKVAIQLWDTAGQERFRSLTKTYFRRCDGVILLYDVTNERSFLSIRHWIQNIEEGAGRKVPIVLCGNKIDLREGFYGISTCVSTDIGRKLGAQCGAIFIETSPKTGENVLESLYILAKEMTAIEDAELISHLHLDFKTEEKEKKSCCGGISKKSIS